MPRGGRYVSDLCQRQPDRWIHPASDGMDIIGLCCLCWCWCWYCSEEFRDRAAFFVTLAAIYRSFGVFCPATSPEGEVCLIHTSVHPTVKAAPMKKSALVHSGRGWEAAAATAAFFWAFSIQLGGGRQLSNLKLQGKFQVTTDGSELGWCGVCFPSNVHQKHIWGL